MDFHQRNQERC